MQNQLASILNDRASWAQYEPAVQNALAGLLRKKQEEDELLSQSTIMGNADTAVAMNPQNQLSVLMGGNTPQRATMPVEQPMNSLRNNDTGATYGFQSQSPAPAPRANPVDRLISLGQQYNLPQEDVEAMIDYDSTAQPGMPSAQSLYSKAQQYGVPFSLLFGANRIMAKGDMERQDQGLKRQSTLLDLEAKQIQNRDARTAGKTAPPGYRYTPEGSLEAIPGGPADIKAGLEGDKRAMRQQVLSDQADNVLTTVTEAKKNIRGLTTGWGGLLSNVPNTDARKLAGQMETIKANLGFDRLQQMRDMSPTGGALGQVAVQELNALRSTVAALDQLQDPADVQEALGKIEQHYTRWKKTLTGEGSGASGSWGDVDPDKEARYQAWKKARGM